jgi:hypothetical protein
MMKDSLQQQKHPHHQKDTQFCAQAGKSAGGGDGRCTLRSTIRDVNFLKASLQVIYDTTERVNDQNLWYT